ncbi:MAG: ABC transporter permease [Spirochaetales bacterium]|jgi:ribose/xylose/arabinose/galactoside ABC-type transport system permease subunit|nr:ABC transporter permease [Spirochaetales bacterium]
MRSKSSVIKNFVNKQPVLLLFIFFILLMVVIKPTFVSINNIKNILIDVSIYGVSALAMTIAIITGAFDLSLAANFAWGQIFFCFLLNAWGESPGAMLAALVVMLLSTMLVGVINGLIVVVLRVPAFIATMATGIILKGFSLVFTKGNMISTSNPFIRQMGRGTFLGLSYLTYIFIAFVILAYFVMTYTRFGRGLYATGGNMKAAELSGINVKLSRFSIFVILGFAAGISGAMFVCLMRAGSVLYGTDLALTCVAATVVGGTPLTGGKGSVLRTVVGILLIYVLYKGLAFLGLQGYYNTMIRGIVLLSVVSIDAFMTRGERW